MVQGFSWHNVGIFLAVFAGVYSLGINAWGATSQGTEFDSVIWVFLTIVIGIGYIAAAVIIDSRRILAKSLLVIGAIVQVGSAVYFGDILNGGLGAALVDLIPAVLALISAAIIGPRKVDTVM